MTPHYTTRILPLATARRAREKERARLILAAVPLLALFGILGAALAGDADSGGPDGNPVPAPPAADPARDDDAPTWVDALPVYEDEGICVYRMPEAWELWALDNGCSEGTLSLILEVAAEQQREDVNVGALIVSIALPESTFNTDATGSAGELGLIQLDLFQEKDGLIVWDRRPRFKELGLDWQSEHDRLTFCLTEMIFPALDEGKSLYAALRPWAVRAKAHRTYLRLVGEAE